MGCDIFWCCFCFPETPVDDDPRKGFVNRWQVTMKDAPTKECGWCFFGALCLPCAQYQLRTRALEYRMENYRCCQGYVDCCGVNNGCCHESSCPELCLCCEVCCCTSCAINATRFMLMDRFSIVSDPCDNRIIRFNNFMQLLACVLELLSICISELRDAANIVRIIARIVYLCTAGCMTAQIKAELDFRESVGQMGGGGAPQQQQQMNREAPPPPMQQHQNIAVAQAVPVNQSHGMEAKPVDAKPAVSTI